MICKVVKINHSHDLIHEVALNSDAYTYIRDPYIATHLSDMANRVRRTGKPYQCITWIETPGHPPKRILYRITIEKLNKTDLLLITYPIGQQVV